MTDTDVIIQKLSSTNRVAFIGEVLKAEFFNPGLLCDLPSRFTTQYFNSANSVILLRT